MNTKWNAWQAKLQCQKHGSFDIQQASNFCARNLPIGKISSKKNSFVQVWDALQESRRGALRHALYPSGGRKKT
jgi:hypothetical protein